MAWIMFVDESGQDHKESPYEVLAGVAVSDTRLWNLIVAIHHAELEYFGRRISRGDKELKARELLKTKTYRLARSKPEFEPEDRYRLARFALASGAQAKIEHLAALGQAKIAFVTRVLELCATHDAKVLASIVNPDSPNPSPEPLRKDYAYLFERFYNLLNSQSPEQQGIVVFDELEKTKAHLLVGQMDEYFLKTAKGKTRASKIIPEPF